MSLSVDERRRKIDALIESVPPIVVRHHGADSCVLGSNLGRALLREVGVDAKLTPVRMITYNRQMGEAIADPDGGRNIGRLFEPWSPDEDQAAHDAGARSVLVGWAYPDEDVSQRFVGHVVLSVRNPDGLIDLTIEQAARPQHGINVDPCFFPVPRADLLRFMRGIGAVGFETEDGTGIVYGYAADLAPRLPHLIDIRLPTDGHRAVHRATLEDCRGAFQNRLASDRAPS